jgi:hypothetical protein
VALEGGEEVSPTDLEGGRRGEPEKSRCLAGLGED